MLKVTEKDKKGQGGGVAEEGEFIDVVEMGVEEVRIPTKSWPQNWIFNKKGASRDKKFKSTKMAYDQEMSDLPSSFTTYLAEGDKVRQISLEAI